jgi:hypothetical protein
VIPRGVEVYVTLDPIDMRCYAESSVMRSRLPTRRMRALHVV